MQPRPSHKPPRIRFKPVEVRARHDGWIAARQFRFIETLAATRSVTAACRAVGKSRESAYALRDRPEARSFRLAWRAALEPDFAQERRRRHRRPLSPRAVQHFRRLLEQAGAERQPGEGAEVEEAKEVKEVEDSPVSSLTVNQLRQDRQDRQLCGPPG